MSEVAFSASAAGAAIDFPSTVRPRIGRAHLEENKIQFDPCNLLPIYVGPVKTTIYIFLLLYESQITVVENQVEPHLTKPGSVNRDPLSHYLRRFRS